MVVAFVLTTCAAHVQAASEDAPAAENEVRIAFEVESDRATGSLARGDASQVLRFEFSCRAPSVNEWFAPSQDELSRASAIPGLVLSQRGPVASFGPGRTLSPLPGLAIETLRR